MSRCHGLFLSPAVTSNYLKMAGSLMKGRSFTYTIPGFFFLDAVYAVNPIVHHSPTEFDATAEMCKELVPRITFICSHVLDEPAFLIEWDACGNCGELKAGPEHLGQTTKRDPCDDCQENKVWVQVDGVWRKAI
jgi:hypothetical protein